MSQEHNTPHPLTHASIKDGWFSELSDDSFPGQAFKLKVEEILLAEKSEYQDILVFKSATYGNVLVLDGIIQCTERDEFSYQEHIAHVPMFAHPNPKRVLIIGGGDGGVLREVLKHESQLEEVILVEIDEYVINLSKKFFPEMSVGFEHPKVKVVLNDGFKFLQQNKKQFDVIITDSSDPEGPAQNFFELKYFNLLNDSLTENNGIIISQSSENIWLNVPKIKHLLSIYKQIFPVVQYCYTCTPSYTSGQLGLVVCSNNKNFDISKPVRILRKEEEQLLFKYYNSRLHEASFILPNSAKNYLK